MLINNSDSKSCIFKLKMPHIDSYEISKFSAANKDLIIALTNRTQTLEPKNS